MARRSQLCGRKMNRGKGPGEKAGLFFCMFWKVEWEREGHMEKFDVMEEQETLEILKHNCVGVSSGFSEVCPQCES